MSLNPIVFYMYLIGQAIFVLLFTYNNLWWCIKTIDDYIRSINKRRFIIWMFYAISCVVFGCLVSYELGAVVFGAMFMFFSGICWLTSYTHRASEYIEIEEIAKVMTTSFNCIDLKSIDKDVIIHTKRSRRLFLNFIVVFGLQSFISLHDLHCVYTLFKHRTDVDITGVRELLSLYYYIPITDTKINGGSVGPDNATIDVDLDSDMETGQV
jgi:hypothetical protein